MVGGGDDLILSPSGVYLLSSSKFCKAKYMYNCGSFIEGHWGLGLWRHREESLFPRSDRVKGKLETQVLPILHAHILPGIQTCCSSDMWKAYDCLKDEGCSHLTVNHSLNFVDPDTGAHT